ncbi:methyltransferase [Natrialba chahannaoensis JCM 10990]|uniref:Methyltransferase n=1 Tax=Natrialba chahannaoensis JCM 10990 TaxID=1227492 RepID=M0AE23_9EURY|nr:class I SAM-dependent methyltransferase [Natrialba chahannaoensis]ELY96117.1 methyltransferase [Natrialba chahannaoensis JCM 10990]
MKSEIDSYWSGEANDYQAGIKTELTANKSEWQAIFQRALGATDLDVLDVGTGPGVLALLLSELGHDVTGMDFSREMLEHAADNVDEFDPSVGLAQGDAENLPFKSGQFDAVVNRHLLFTLPDPESALTEWKRVLKPGGKLVFADGNFYGNLDRTLKRRLWRYLGHFLVLCTERRLNANLRMEVVDDLPLTEVPRPKTDVQLLERVGFEEITVENRIDRQTKSTFEYLKSGYWGEAFLVAATKP